MQNKSKTSYPVKKPGKCASDLLELDRSNLRSPSTFLKALGSIPSRSVVDEWLFFWPELDSCFGPGHCHLLESVLLKSILEEGRLGFRSAWVTSLLIQRGLLAKRVGLEAELMEALERTSDAGKTRELMRSLLGLNLSKGALQDLCEWAVEVVHLPEEPPSSFHRALQILDRVLKDMERNDFVEVERCLESLQALKNQPGSKSHHKKKATLLMARLSGIV